MTKKRTRVIAVGDVHGCYGLLKQLVEESIGFNPDLDTLIFLGDYIDFRNTRDRIINRETINSAKVVRYLSELRDKFPAKVILLKGNHESLAETYFDSKNPYDLEAWKRNGGNETIASFAGLRKAGEVLRPFIESLRLYYQTPDADFVHANVPRGKTLETAPEHELLWDRGYYNGERILVTGHSIHRDVVRDGNKIMIDTGASFTGKLTALDTRSDEIYEAMAEAF